MSVYIEGLKKPGNCDECPISLWALPEKCNLMIDDCPIKEIEEPHGDLIDRNKVKSTYRGGFHDDFFVDYDSVYGQDPVIKAEGETAKDPWKEMYEGD